MATVAVTVPWNICSSKYANITRDAVEHSKSFCVVL